VGTNHISGTAEAGLIEFCIQIGLYQIPTYGVQISLKRGVVRVMWPILNIGAHNDISGTGEASHQSLPTGRQYQVLRFRYR